MSLILQTEAVTPFFPLSPESRVLLLHPTRDIFDLRTILRKRQERETLFFSNWASVVHRNVQNSWQNISIKVDFLDSRKCLHYTLLTKHVRMPTCICGSLSRDLGRPSSNPGLGRPLPIPLLGGRSSIESTSEHFLHK